MPPKTIQNTPFHAQAPALAGAAGALAFIGQCGLLIALQLRDGVIDKLSIAFALAIATLISMAVFVLVRRVSADLAQSFLPSSSRPGIAPDPLDPMVTFEHTLAAARARTARHGGSISVLAICSDQYEECRNALGDAVAKTLDDAVIERIASVVRADEMVHRVGDNRFMAVIIEADETALRLVIDRINRQFDAILPLGSEKMAISLSIGIAYDQTGANGAGAMIRSAEIAMAEARAQGGDRAVFYHHELDDIAHARVTITRDLRNALARGDELALVFQPTWSLQSGKITGAEALLRWNHAIHGRLSAQFLISLAEDSGLIDRMSHWAFEAGIAPLKTAGVPMAGFNLSMAQITSDSVVDHLRELAQRHKENGPKIMVDFPPMALEHEEGAAALRRLRMAGVSLCLDGLGDKPLAMAQTLTEWVNRTGTHVDRVKIDLRAFPALAVNQDEQAQFFALIMHLRRAGIPVAVKTVETSDQLARLQTLGISDVQGNHLAAPVTGSTLIRLMDTSSPSSFAQAF